MWDWGRATIDLVEPPGPSSDESSRVVGLVASPGSWRDGWPLGIFAVGYNVVHHNGLFGSAEVGRDTRLADWIDVLTPFVVLVPLLWFLALQRPRWGVWLAAAMGSILYVEGHGIHLSANSIGNVAASQETAERTVDVIHLWDEVVGHYFWYAGFAVVLCVCALSVRGRLLGLPAWRSVIGGAATGLTWATNGLEGGTAVFSLAVAVAALGLVQRRGAGLSIALLAGGVVAIGVLGGYGLWHGGFPQPSSL